MNTKPEQELYDNVRLSATVVGGVVAMAAGLAGVLGGSWTRISIAATIVGLVSIALAEVTEPVVDAVSRSHSRAGSSSGGRPGRRGSRCSGPSCGSRPLLAADGALTTDLNADSASHHLCDLLDLEPSADP
jgi:hypothetical protein